MREKMRNPKSFVGSALSEALEPRRLLAGIEAGVLVAQGTGANDTISIRRHLSDDVIVTTNGVDQAFDMDDFTGVRLEGLGGNDTIRVIDPIQAGSLVRPVTLRGGDGNDTLTGSAGAESLLGEDGDDSLAPGDGNDTVSGGNGTDTVDYSGHAAGLHFSLTSFFMREGPTVTRTGETDTLATFVNSEDDRILDTERFIGTAFNDSFHYQASENDEDSGFPTITMEGRGGNDTFSNGGIFDRFVAIGGNGDDRFNIGAGTNGSAAETTLIGGDGNDTFNFGSDTGPDSIDGGSGIDLITLSFFTQSVVDLNEFTSVENARSAAPDVLLTGTAGPNRLEITNSGTIQGGDGDDTLIGSQDPDSLIGGYGNDSIDGGAGSDTADGGPGANTIVNVELQPPPGTIGIVNGVLIADGKWGQDLITIERTGGDNVIVRVNEVVREFDMDDFTGVLLRGNGGFDDIFVLDPIVAGSLVRNVTLEGGAGNDSLRGSSGNEVINGGGGNDRLFGEGGADAVFGDGGNDYLVGGLGIDFLDGSDGHDYLDAVDGAPGDTVLGGDGFDTARIDPGDGATNIEALA